MEGSWRAHGVRNEGWPPRDHPCCSPVEMTARPWLIDPRGVCPAIRACHHQTCQPHAATHPLSLLYHSVPWWFAGALACPRLIRKPRNCRHD